MMRHKTTTRFIFLLPMFFVVFFVRCDTDYIPKPYGYLRIDLPEHTYRHYDSLEKYRFEFPEYAFVTHDLNSPLEKNWINIEFPLFKGSLHISHKEVKGNLNEYLEDAHTMLTKHLPKANAIRDSLIIDSARDMYGIVYSIEGKSVASPIQFYLTDSTTNYVRGALYFNIHPNNDSLAPVISFLRKDILHFINTLEWK